MDSYEKIYYIGNKPDIIYYNNISNTIYNNIPQNWDAKKETKKYIKNDISI
jgi:hypothetical protein